MSGRGATAVTKTGNAFTVTFNKDVSKCSFTASPTATGTAAPAVSSTAGHGDQVTVDFGSGAGATTSSFHLQVIC